MDLRPLLALIVVLQFAFRADAGQLVSPIDLMRNGSVSRASVDDGSPQTKRNAEMEFITFHATDTEEGDGSEVDEVRIIRSIDLEKHGGVPYHYIVANSGRVYFTRPLEIVPASNTWYFPVSGPSSPTKFDKSGQVDSGPVWTFYTDLLMGRYNQWREQNAEDARVWEREAEAKLPGIREEERSSGKRESELSTLTTLKRKKALEMLAPGNSSGHLTIAFLCRVKTGNPSGPAYESAAKLAAQLLDQYGKGINSIKVHRECAFTNCPGESVYKWLRVNPLIRPAKLRGPEGVGNGLYTIQWYLRSLTE